MGGLPKQVFGEFVARHAGAYVDLMSGRSDAVVLRRPVIVALR